MPYALNAETARRWATERAVTIFGLGDRLDPATDIGTVIAEADAVEFERRTTDALTAGAKFLISGERTEAQITPTVLDQVRPDMEIVACETFRPYAPIILVHDLDEEIGVANGTEFGLSSGGVTNDLRAIYRSIRKLRGGTVNIREVPGYRTELTSFGGTKDSGLGVKEGVVEAMRAMTFTKLYTLPLDYRRTPRLEIEHARLRRAAS